MQASPPLEWRGCYTSFTVMSIYQSDSLRIGTLAHTFTKGTQALDPMDAEEANLIAV